MTAQLGAARVRGWVKVEVPIAFAEGEQPTVEVRGGEVILPDNLQFEVEQRANGRWLVGIVSVYGPTRRKNGTASEMRLGASWVGPLDEEFMGPNWAADAVREALADGIVMGSRA